MPKRKFKKYISANIAISAMLWYIYYQNRITHINLFIVGTNQIAILFVGDRFSGSFLAASATGKLLGALREQHFIPTLP